MPANPIQRKTRNSFLAGMLIMLLIAIVIVGVLYFTMFSDMFSGNSNTSGGSAYAYVLSAEVKSGETIEVSKIEMVKVSASAIPANYLTDTAGLTEGKYKSKVDLKAGTVLSNSLVYEDEKLADSARIVEYNMLTLPSTLRVGDYIDVRFTLPNGQNFIVLSKKEVISIKNTTVSLYLTEDEILMMSSAVIESYIMKASNLQAIQYVEAGTQNASIPTYAINSAVYDLIRSDASKENIKDYSDLNKILSDTLRNDLRAEIEQELAKYYGYEITNIQEGIDEEKETAMELYLSGLEGY